MLRINKIREYKAKYIDLLKIKNMDAAEFFDLVIDLDDRRKLTQQKVEQLLAKGNKLASHIGDLYKSGNQEKAIVLKQESLSIWPILIFTPVK